MMSHARATSKPPPRAYPFTAAITGLFIFSRADMATCPLCEKVSASTGFMGCISAMSAPATKALLPSPVTMTTLTASFVVQLVRDGKEVVEGRRIEGVERLRPVDLDDADAALTSRMTFS